MIVRARKILFLLIYLGLAGVFAFAFFDRYYLRIDCFNENAHCYDPETGLVFLEVSMVWSVFSAVFAGLALLSILRLRR